MNDRLKFRAWDKKNKKIVKNIGFYQDKIIYPEWALEDIKYFEIMQDTGLKDKNGKETFSGDIVSDGINQPFVVDLWNFPLMVRLSEIEFEIIGNVWEHPQLLTPNK